MHKANQAEATIYILVLRSILVFSIPNIVIVIVISPIHTPITGNNQLKHPTQSVLALGVLCTQIYTNG
jgi:hypothetical protein